jgi:hypothetical protein
MEETDYIELQKKFSILNAKLAASATIKDCFHHRHDECEAPIKNAHSLQRQGALKQLERNVNGNSFLYSHTESFHNKEGDFLDLKPIGRKAASTFFGFCDFHDTKLFSKIENDPEATDINSDEHCFLHSYRSFAHSYHRKHEELKLYKSEDPETRQLLIDIHGEYKIRGLTKYVKMALEDLKAPKEKLDFWMENNQFDQLVYLAFEYPHKIPIACAANTSPPYTFSGKTINISTRSDYTYSNIITTVIPFSNRSIVILAAFADEPNGVRYLDEIEDIKYELIQQKFLSYHLLNGAENCYISPHYYDAKSINEKKSYCQMINYISSNETPYLGFNKFFPINYFSKTHALK